MANKSVKIAAALAVAVSGMSATASGAATMNFDTLPDEGAMLSSYVENGITATSTGGTLASYGSPGFAHIDDSGTGLTNGIDFTMGGLFDAVGFSLTSLGYNFWDPPGPYTDNIVVTGFQGSSIVSTATFLLSDIAGTVQSIMLGTGFTSLSKLRIELLYPVNSAACDTPCGHFDLDSVTLNAVGPAPVPLPASGLLLLGAGLAVGGLRLRRRA
ncbi:MAG TPA: hypothetical protein PK450_02520 [Paracoccaceae bacterium]|nr:hypothetical protein [Paracoccaceae bacterium]